VAGEIAVASDAYAVGARLFGVIDADRQLHPASFRLYQQNAEWQAVAEARSALGEEALALAWLDGETTPLEEAIEIALQAQGEQSL